MQVRAHREAELDKRRGHPRASADVLHVRSGDGAVTVDVAADDFVDAYLDGDWSVVIKTLVGVARFDVEVDAQRPLPTPPFEHEVAIGGHSTVVVFPQPLMAGDVIEVGGDRVRVLGVDHSQATPFATCTPM